MDVATDGITVENDSLYPLLSVLKCNILHQIQYHECEPVWYWGILARQVGSPTPIGYSAEIEIELRYLSTFNSENCMQN